MNHGQCRVLLLAAGTFKAASGDSACAPCHGIVNKAHTSCGRLPGVPCLCTDVTHIPACAVLKEVLLDPDLTRHICEISKHTIE